MTQQLDSIPLAGETRTSRPRRVVAIAAAVLLVAAAFVAGRVSAGDDPTSLEVGQQYVIQAPGDTKRVEATYLGACPPADCGSTVVPYRMFQIGDSRAALFLVEWIKPAS
ncbi:MAG: hypothetical protein L0Y54_18240 [Sporichthyaceae bacterium]|nr:hypothetical protein [Sporichthyaceae bacterium]